MNKNDAFHKRLSLLLRWFFTLINLVSPMDTISLLSELPSSDWLLGSDTNHALNDILFFGSWLALDKVKVCVCMLHVYNPIISVHSNGISDGLFTLTLQSHAEDGCAAYINDFFFECTALATFNLYLLDPVKESCLAIRLWWALWYGRCGRSLRCSRRRRCRRCRWCFGSRSRCRSGSRCRCRLGCRSRCSRSRLWCFWFRLARWKIF